MTTFRPMRITPGSSRPPPGKREVTTVTSCPRARSTRTVASTCSVTPPTAGWYAWLTTAILSGIRSPDGPEDAPLAHVGCDVPLLRPRHARGEPAQVLAERKVEVRLVQAVECEPVLAVGAADGVAMEDRDPRAAREDRGARGERDAAPEEIRGEGAGIDVAVHEKRHDLAAPERGDERREAVLKRGDADPRALLERSHLTGQQRVELHARHRVHPEAEPRQSDPDDLPVAQVRHRQDRAASPRDRAVEKLRAGDPERGSRRHRQCRGAAEVFHPAAMVRLEHAPRR